MGQKTKSAIGIVYILLNLPCVWVIKQGVTTTSLDDRRDNIDKTSFGIDIPIFFVPILWPYNTERWFKRNFKWLRYPWRTGSGKTERYWILGLIFFVPILLIVFVVQFGVAIAVIYGALELLQNT